MERKTIPNFSPKTNTYRNLKPYSLYKKRVNFQSIFTILGVTTRQVSLV